MNTNHFNTNSVIPSSLPTDDKSLVVQLFEPELLDNFEYRLHRLTFREADRRNRLIDRIGKVQFAVSALNNTIDLITNNHPFEKWVEKTSDHHRTKKRYQKSISDLRIQLEQVNLSYERYICFLETKFLPLKNSLTTSDSYRLKTLGSMVAEWFDDTDIQKDLLNTLPKMEVH